MATVFFSWQGDTPSKQGRNFIEKALKEAIKNIAIDLSVYESIRELEFDKDTQGVSGQPPIVETIFRKIDNSTIFVPDLTFIGNRLDGRPIPNPNVLIEYGYAIKSKGYSAIIPVMNIAYGAPEADKMPFNMRHLRNPITYNYSEQCDKDSEKREFGKLTKVFEKAIKDILKDKIQINEAKLFKNMEPQDGRGKFRHKDEPIGYLYSMREFLTGESPTAIRFSTGSSLWLRLLPKFQPKNTFLIKDLEKARIKENKIALIPLMFDGLSLQNLRADDGIGNYVSYSMNNIADTLCFAFTSGEIWAVNNTIIDSYKPERTIPDCREALFKSLNEYGNYLQDLGVEPPYRWIAGIEGIKGRGIKVKGDRSFNFMHPKGAITSDIIEIEGLYDPTKETSSSALKDFFVHLYDRCGLNYPDQD